MEFVGGEWGVLIRGQATRFGRFGVNVNPGSINPWLISRGVGTRVDSSWVNITHFSG